jgi:hypothetical protein
MTEPLIDIDVLVRVFWNGDHAYAKDRAMKYLRSVLTPEALNPNRTEYDGDAGSSIHYFENGFDLYRRIFGEDK